MADFKKLYQELSLTSVFGAVLDKPLFKYFESFAKGENKNSSYAKMVSEVYTLGGSLTDAVLKLVFEDENVYVKSRAKWDKVDENIRDAAVHELMVFSEFAALTPEDFRLDMGASYLPAFTSEKKDFVKLYEDRIADIDKHGYGIFVSHPMFRLEDTGELIPIISADKTRLDSFIGYSEERAKVIENTRAFVLGKPAANTLLCGDAGTGKSSTVKAVANAFFEEGVRLIELRKDQLSYLPYVMGKISENPLKFIIFIDDLSFNQNDDNFSMLKAALEGSASAKAENAVIYATSNRRHIVKEYFADREGGDVHRNDTLQETLSLSERFGLVVLFQKPNKALYLDIVHTLAERAGLAVNEELDIKAEAFALRRGSRSARCAEQFINSLL